MPGFRPILERYATGYVDEVAALSYQQLADYQSPPFATLACGAAGIAYALWRATRRDPALLPAARRWTDEALAARSREDAFAGGPFGDQHARWSLFYGPAGIDLCDALISQAAGDARRARRAFGRFAVAARRAAHSSSELIQGGAGFLSGASLLAEHMPGPATRRLEEELARTLAAHAPLDYHGMAHGEAGVLFALLRFAERRRRRLPPAVRAGLERVAALGIRAGSGTRWPTSDPTVSHHGGWCRGSAGYALLFAKAHEVTGDPGHASLARRAARDALATVSGIPDLCCGAVGSAYGMLAMSRIEPGRGWRRRAEELAMAVMVSEIQPEWAHGLFKGEAGTFCLAMDLLSGETRFPCLES